MFNLFKRNSAAQPLDVKIVRDHLLQFLKDELQKSEGGEGAHIDTLLLTMAPTPTDKHLYQTAVYLAEPGKFKQEVQRIADNFSLDMPEDWKLEINFVEELPEDGVHYDALPVSLHIQNRVVPVPVEPIVHTTAQIKVIRGRAEQSSYTLNNKAGRVNVGRDKNTSTSGGLIRVNHIVFPEDPGSPGNRYVSRQHAHLEWDEKKAGFVLFADEGGVPPGNKTKVQSEGEESQIKLNSTQVGHLLKDGDQLIIGESVVLQFNYLDDPA